MGVNTFPTTNHFLVLREEIRNGQKIWGDVNDNKLKGIFDDLKAPDRRPILRKKHRSLAFYTGYYSNVYSISGYRILWIFCAHIMMLPPLTLKKTAVRIIYP